MEPKAHNIQTCQIIAVALMMGVVVFGVVAVVSATPREEPPTSFVAGLPVTTVLAFVLTGGCLLGRALVTRKFDLDLIRTIENEQAAPGEPVNYLERYQTRLIVSLATLEGPAFFALISYMTEVRYEALGLAIFLLLMMAISFPTETRFHHWVETARLNSSTRRGE